MGKLFVHSWHYNKKHPGRNQGGAEKIYSTYCYESLFLE